MGYSPASAIPLSSFGAPTSNISMNSHKFTNLLDGTVALDSAGWDQLPTADAQYAYVASGCVWTADSSGSTLNGSMSAGTVVVGGLLYSLAAVTAHTFAASSDTYVDINLSGGAAQLVYTAVANNVLSPALPSSGTPLNTIRIAIITSTASALTTGVNTINQGQNVSGPPGTTAQTSTVAAGSNGNAINTATLSVAANSLPSAGIISVVASGGTAALQYTSGGGTTTLSGVTVLFGTVSWTVATGAAITTLASYNATDSIGNLLFNTRPYPNLVGRSSFSNAFTTTSTAASPGVPVGGTTGLLMPVLVPAGLARRVKVTLNAPFFGSSAAAGTTCSATIYAENTAVPIATAVMKVAVASDGAPLYFSDSYFFPAGLYYAALWVIQGAAGTLSVGNAFNITTLAAEFV